MTQRHRDARDAGNTSLVLGTRERNCAKIMLRQRILLLCFLWTLCSYLGHFLYFQLNSTAGVDGERHGGKAAIFGREPEVIADRFKTTKAAVDVPSETHERNESQIQRPRAREKKSAIGFEREESKDVSIDLIGAKIAGEAQKLEEKIGQADDVPHLRSETFVIGLLYDSNSRAAWNSIEMAVNEINSASTFLQGACFLLPFSSFFCRRYAETSDSNCFLLRGFWHHCRSATAFFRRDGNHWG